jgi:hypothetical protein
MKPLDIVSVTHEHHVREHPSGGAHSADASYHIIYVTDAERSLTHYPVCHSKILGILQIVFGVALIILAACAIHVNAIFFFVGYGFWTGVIAIIAGGLGIAAAFLKSKCLIAAHLVMCIISAVVNLGPFILAVAAACLEDDLQYRYAPRPPPAWDYSQDYDDGLRDRRMAVDCLLAIFLILASVVAIWASGIGCLFCCCCECCWPSCCSCYKDDSKANRVSSGWGARVAAPVEHHVNAVADAGKKALKLRYPSPILIKEPTHSHRHPSVIDD